MPVAASKATLSREKAENAFPPLEKTNGQSLRCSSITARAAKLSGRVNSCLVLFLPAGRFQLPPSISFHVMQAASARRAPVNNRNLRRAGKGPDCLLFQIVLISLSVRIHDLARSFVLVRAIPLTMGGTKLSARVAYQFIRDLISASARSAATGPDSNSILSSSATISERLISTTGR